MVEKGRFCRRKCIRPKVFSFKGPLFLLLLLSIDNEDELFLRLFFKEKRVKEEGKLKEKTLEVKNVTEYDKKLLGDLSVIKEKRPFISEFYRKAKTNV